ncbi:MAG: cyclic nucleotide-binding domain-containing protein [Myxococcales bacterium]|nr:cyclic nucleotide-binding domain-containing protein [Myxococcales bacterium]
MRTRVKLAASPSEIRSLMEVRHTVFVEEEGYLPPQHGGAIADLFDALPTTANLVALTDGEVGGGLRITLDSPAGMPADDFFDFRAVLDPGAEAASCSMLCMKRSARGARLLLGMMQMCIYWASVRQVSHLCAPMNPKACSLVEPIGFARVGEPFVDAKGLPTVPMVLDMAELSADFVRFNQRQDVGLWMDSFERAFFEPGQPIVEEGQAGDEAYLVVHGKAVALAAGAAPTDVRSSVQTFAPGDVFGELAVLTERPRSTTVVATEQTDAMVLHRHQFERQVATNPDLALALMRSIGDRFHDAVQRRA